MFGIYKKVSGEWVRQERDGRFSCEAEAERIRVMLYGLGVGKEWVRVGRI